MRPWSPIARCDPVYGQRLSLLWAVSAPVYGQKKAAIQDRGFFSGRRCWSRRRRRRRCWSRRRRRRRCWSRRRRRCWSRRRCWLRLRYAVECLRVRGTVHRRQGDIQGTRSTDATGLQLERKRAIGIGVVDSNTAGGWTQDFAVAAGFKRQSSTLLVAGYCRGRKPRRYRRLRSRWYP